MTGNREYLAFTNQLLFRSLGTYSLWASFWIEGMVMCAKGVNDTQVQER